MPLKPAPTLTPLKVSAILHVAERGEITLREFDALWGDRPSAPAWQIGKMMQWFEDYRIFSTRRRTTPRLLSLGNVGARIAAVLQLWAREATEGEAAQLRIGGHDVMIDADDRADLVQLKWRVHKNVPKTTLHKLLRGVTVPMGHLIVGADPKHDHLVHLDENPLNCQRNNLCVGRRKAARANRGRRLPAHLIPSEVHESLLYDLKTLEYVRIEDGAEVARSARAADLLAGDIIVP